MLGHSVHGDNRRRVQQDFPFKLMGGPLPAPLAPASRSLDFDGDNKTDTNAIALDERAIA